MSGFVAEFGQSGGSGVESMMKTITHRGPHAQGIHSIGNITMAQNYLRADIAGDTENPGVPLVDGGTAICYDGEIGNWSDLAGNSNVAAGPLKDERLLLAMYQEHGTGMFEYLDDAVFTFLISDGERCIAARDVLGIKTLFYGKKDNNIFLSSELKGLVGITDDVNEFPAGHYMDGSGSFTSFASLPASPPEVNDPGVGTVVENIRDIIRRSFHSRIDFTLPTGSLLSGGIDSSVIACIASRAYKERFGDDARLKTFALGVGESGDIINARKVAEALDTEHHELIVGLQDLLDVLPQVIYHLESFDPSLVRSSIANYLISKFAADLGIEVLLSGEGGDEVFCGYTFFKKLAPELLFENQIKCLGYLHSNASLRLDRMNACNSVKVVTPLISGELLNYSLSLPPEYKIKDNGKDKVEKWIFRKSFENDLPESVVWRLKQEFSQGSGSADVLPSHFEPIVSDEDLAAVQSEFPIIRSKEECYYFNIFREHFSSSQAVNTVGQWVSL
jgi:asparagine synthase (glutamine-hydrolysing)